MEIHNDEADEFLSHFGIKGMKWGVRKDQLPGVPGSTYREAGRDAKEFTRAKMYYGEGAGTRRKLIKATVEAKSKRDPAYAKAFDHHVTQTDMAKRAAQARGERKRTNVGNATKKTAKGVGHILGGRSEYANAAAIGVVAAATYAYHKGYDRDVQRFAKSSFQDAVKYLNNRR